MLSSYEEELRKSREEEKKNREFGNRPAGGYPQRGRYIKPPAFDKDTPPVQPGEPPHDVPPHGAPPQDTPSKDKPKSNPEAPYNPDDKERMDEPYMTFPGYIYGDPTHMPYPDPRYGPPPGGPAGPGMPPSFYPPMYPNYPRRPLDAFGATALTLGIVSMCIFWIPIFPFSISTILYIVIISLSGIGIIFGGYAFASKRRRSIQGLVGMILSIIAIILSSIIWSFVTSTWGYIDMIH
ncbi:MAG: hypothetical protein KAJ51_04340 [Thermoplasmata archaeon]|nr:hypothetical protein [Thermoplasmata archaeon]